MSNQKFCLITVDAEADLDTHNTSEKTYHGVHALESTLQEILDTWNIEATIFATGEAIKECTTILKTLCQRNELAAHGLHHIPIVSLPTSSRKEQLARLCSYASQKLNRDLKGFRAVKFMIDVETLKILNRLGFIYDSSVLPRYVPLKGYVGFQGRALTYPYHPSELDCRRSGQSKIWELPISCARIINFPLNGTWIRYVGSKITKFLFPDDNYINIAVHSWDFVKTTRYGYRTGKDFCHLLGDIIDFLHEKNFTFLPGTSFCRHLNEMAVQ